MRLSSVYKPWRVATDVDWERIGPKRAKAIAAKCNEVDTARSEMLLALIRRTKGFESTSDRSPRKWMRSIGEWVQATVTMKMVPKAQIMVRGVMGKRQHDEVLRYYQQQGMWEVNPVFHSVAMDCGLALGRCIRNRFPQLTWKRCSARSFNEYNHPILALRANSGYSAVDTGSLLLDAIASNRGGPEVFVEHYDMWIENFEGEYHQRLLEGP